jgi:hypothetical protein
MVLPESTFISSASAFVRFLFLRPYVVATATSVINSRVNNWVCSTTHFCHCIQYQKELTDLMDLELKS